ncbi:hypothetical protein ACMBCN_00900, partial [Candidatus Liberibacter asiaticus]|nr:hypothetical protein [Candidatus Liberibacter asiaticus]
MVISTRKGRLAQKLSILSHSLVFTISEYVKKKKKKKKKKKERTGMSGTKLCALLGELSYEEAEALDLTASNGRFNTTTLDQFFIGSALVFVPLMFSPSLNFPSCVLFTL